MNFPLVELVPPHLAVEEEGRVVVIQEGVEEEGRVVVVQGE